MPKAPEHYQSPNTLRFPDESKKYADAWCYPPGPDDDYRLCAGATNNWQGDIQTVAGDEVLELSAWAVKDFAKAFTFAQDMVRCHNLERFNIVFDDYPLIAPTHG